VTIGFCANLALYVLQFAGSNIDRDIGLAMVSIFDPMTRQQTGFTGSLYQYAFMLIMMITNLHHYILKAFFEGITLIPIGSVQLPSENLIKVMTGYIMDAFIIAFRIYLPIYATMLLLNSVLGILAKVVPQMNMFSVGVQLKIIVGFTALIMTTSLIPVMSGMISAEMKKMITNVIEVISTG
jgi:flagellar biosynthetic protein FliR